MYLINRKLKEFGKMIGVPLPLTIYVARHSWASVTKKKNVPIAVISERMGHDSEMTTQIYFLTSSMRHPNLNLLLDRSKSGLTARCFSVKKSVLVK